MSWPVVWLDEAEADLLDIHYEIASGIVQAVRRWAETGEGWTELLDRDEIRIAAPGASCSGSG